MKLNSIKDRNVNGLQQRVIEFENGLILSSADERLRFRIMGDATWWTMHSLSAHLDIKYIKVSENGTLYRPEEFPLSMEAKQ